MKPHWLALACLAPALPAAAHFPVQSPAIKRVAHEVSPYLAGRAAPGTVQQAAQSGAQLLAGGSDDCSTAEAISGTGLFAFNNGAATTGLNGQNNSPDCTFFNATAIALDVWFLWTAPTSGVVILSTCGQTAVDTKLAVYDWAANGSTCPANGAAAPVLACNEDISAGSLQSIVAFNATAGAQYLIQLGSYPEVPPAQPLGGTGNLSIGYDPLPEVNPCTLDDGSADVRFRFNAAGNATACIMQAFGDAGEVTTVSSVLVSYGALFAAGNTALVNGTPVTIAIWDDPTDDYDPSDAVLRQTVASTILNHDTDLFNTVNLAGSEVLNGVFFVGWTIKYPATLPANYYPFAIDLENCEALPGDCWGAWTAANVAFNFATLTSNLQPPGAFFPTINGTLALNTAAMLRINCSVAPTLPGSSVCSNATLGVDHATACPCGNAGSGPNGCAHSFSADGANLAASGVIADDDVLGIGPNPVILTCSNMPSTAFTLFMQHDAPADAVFHDGVLCAGGTLLRLRGRAAGPGQGQPNGVAIFPNDLFANDATLTLSSRGGQTPGNGNTRRYAGWYRNASTTYCPPATANVTNGWEITW